MKNKKLFAAATELRKGEKSYSEISRLLNVSKGTLSYWFSNEEWSRDVSNALNKVRLTKSKIYLKSANEKRMKNDKIRRENYIFEARREFYKKIKNPLFLLGLGLYWGEGDKIENGRVAVINSDPDLIKMISRFYKESIGIDESRLRVGIFLYEDLDSERVLTFWSNCLDIPRTKFIKTQILKSRSKMTHRRAKYGMCSLYFSSTEFSIKIHEWIKMLSTSRL